MPKSASAMAETICPPHIGGRHRMLYLNIQRTEKYSIAMCYHFPGGGSLGALHLYSLPCRPTLTSEKYSNSPSHLPLDVIQIHIKWET